MTDEAGEAAGAIAAKVSVESDPTGFLDCLPVIKAPSMFLTPHCLLEENDYNCEKENFLNVKR
jgi:hypothetical protein